MEELGFDIETIPNVDLVDALPTPEVNFGNTKDPDKRAVIIEDAKKDQIDKMALNPFWGRVCSYSFFGENVQVWKTMDEISDASEIGLITDIFTRLSGVNNIATSLITWNGFNFDLPFVFKRAMLLKMVPMCNGLSYWCKKYTHYPHCDMKQEIASWGNDYTSLDTASRLILGERKIGLDVTKFIQMIKDGQSSEIGIYNLKDAELTYKIFKAASPYFF